MMAVSRYIAVCHPLHARSFINQRGTLITIAAVWLGSFLINLPRFWHYQPVTLPCRQLGLPVVVPADCRCFYYQKLPGALFRNSGFKSAYTITWATVAIFVPLVAMIICNWCLVRALRRSSAMQQRCCRISSSASARVALNDSVDFRLMSNRNRNFSRSSGFTATPSSAGHRITPTLVALVVLFVVLVGPSEMLTFAKDFVMTQQVIANITNFCIYLFVLCFYRAMLCIVERGIAMTSRLSVRPSVCLFVTLRYRDHIRWNSFKIISRLISL